MAAHKISQNATPDELTPAQRAALSALLAGQTVTAAAQQAGMRRETVHAWLREPSGEMRPEVSLAQSVALAVMGFVTLAAGIYPEPFIRIATYSMTLPAALFVR